MCTIYEPVFEKKARKFCAKLCKKNKRKALEDQSIPLVPVKQKTMERERRNNLAVDSETARDGDAVAED